MRCCPREQVLGPLSPVALGCFTLRTIHDRVMMGTNKPCTTLSLLDLRLATVCHVKVATPESIWSQYYAVLYCSEHSRDRPVCRKRAAHTSHECRSGACSKLAVKQSHRHNRRISNAPDEM